jgi:hypothetical protein
MPHPTAATDASTATSPERLALAGGWALLLAPMAVHMVWRPALHALGGTGGDALLLSLAALAVGLAAVLGSAAARPSGWRSLAVAALLTVALGGTSAERAATGLSLLSVLVVVGVAFPRMVRQVPSAIDGSARRSRPLSALIALSALLALVQTTRVSSFLGDAERLDCLPMPELSSFANHSCLTAYVQGARLADRGEPNLYEASWWPHLGDNAVNAVEAQPYAPFELDTFAYPPPFLIAPKLLTLLTDDFAAQRALWFGLCGLFVALGLWEVGAWVGARNGPAGARLLTLGFLLWESPMTMISVQVGNVHAVVMVAAVLAMIALERGRTVLGAAMLSAVILSKISPGLLGLVLLLQWRWREAFATAACAAAWTLLTLAWFGPAPFLAFLQYELPRLRSGEALAFFAESSLEIAINLAPFGVPHKLELLGLPIVDPWASARLIGSAFTVFAVLLTLCVGTSRRGDRSTDLGLWLAVLSLAALNSPFAPGYCLFTVLWMTIAWPASQRPRRDAALIALVFAVCHVTTPVSATVMTLFSMIQQALVLGLLTASVLTVWSRRAEPVTPAPAR